jgi:hypothetical protein
MFTVQFLFLLPGVQAEVILAAGGVRGGGGYGKKLRGYAIRSTALLNLPLQIRMKSC